MQAVWGYSNETYESNVITHINRIRNKIETDAAQPRYILTIRGMGYHFAEISELSAEPA